MVEKMSQDFLIIWATIDPISTMALFAALTANLTPTERRKTAFKTILYSAIVLLGALLVGANASYCNGDKFIVVSGVRWDYFILVWD